MKLSDLDHINSLAAERDSIALELASAREGGGIEIGNETITEKAAVGEVCAALEARAGRIDTELGEYGVTVDEDLEEAAKRINAAYSDENDEEAE